MKKVVFIILTFIVTLALFACSKAEVEKYPVVVEETRENITDDEDLKSILSSMTSVNESDSGETKKMTIELEGIKEEINVQTYKSNLGYQIDYDIDRFTLISEDGTDSFIAKDTNPDIVPYVYVGIYRLREMDKNIFIEGLLYESIRSNKEFGAVEHNESVQLSDEITAEHIYVRTGSEWNSLIRHYYIIDIDDDLLFIETQYFMEAEEGYGARIQYMLNTIR